MRLADGGGVHGVVARLLAGPRDGPVATVLVSPRAGVVFAPEIAKKSGDLVRAPSPKFRQS